MNRSEIRGIVRTWLNEATAGFWTDAELNTFIDLGNQKVNNLVSTMKEDYFTVSVTWQTTANTKSYTLPADFRSMVRVEFYNPADASDIEKIDPIDFPRTEDSANWPWDSVGKPQRYIIRGNQADFWPIPDDAYNIRYYYDQKKNDLASDAASPLSPSEYHDMIAIWATILALPKNHENSEEFKDLWKERREDLIQAIAGRKGLDPETVEGYLEGWQ